jgi:hypothetical protein
MAYNTRFLILPHVQVPNLASHLLARIVKRISADWQASYKHPLYYLETFVDTEGRGYRGSCYHGAGWKYLGETTGRGKNAKSMQPTRSRKAVWGYALAKDFREYLSGRATQA